MINSLYVIRLLEPENPFCNTFYHYCENSISVLLALRRSPVIDKIRDRRSSILSITGLLREANKTDLEF